MTMGMREFTKSGAFVAIVFVLVVVLVPFGLEQIGEATGFFDFPVTKTISGWFGGRQSSAADKLAPVARIDWERYRQDLEEFSKWAEGQSDVVISLPPREEVEIDVKEDDEKPERRLWSVPIVSCTAGDSTTGRRGYMFISGFDHPFNEGAMIEPSEELCGFEIVFIGERSVWLRAVFELEGDARMGIVKFPEFTRVEGESLVRGNRKYVARDAFPLASGGWLMIDSFMPPDGVVFKILDEKRCVVTSLLCVVIGEKGGK